MPERVLTKAKAANSYVNLSSPSLWKAWLFANIFLLEAEVYGKIAIRP